MEQIPNNSNEKNEEQKITPEKIQAQINDLENKIDKVIESNDSEKMKSALKYIKNNLSKLKTTMHKYHGSREVAIFFEEFDNAIKNLAIEIAEIFKK